MQTIIDHTRTQITWAQDIVDEAYNTTMFSSAPRIMASGASTIINREEESLLAKVAAIEHQ